VKQDTMHPKDERLEAYSAGVMAGADQAAVESHVIQCARCRSEVEDWRSLFATLAGLPVLAPSAGFADRVMANVRIRHAWHARAGNWIGRFVPQTTGGWMVAVALLSIPVLAVGSMAFWLLSRSYLTGYRLWVFATDQFATGTNQVASDLLTRLMQTDVAVWVATSMTSFVETAGLRGMSVMAAGLAGVIMVSIWVLYRNLFRTPNRGSTYVSYTF